MFILDQINEKTVSNFQFTQSYCELKEMSLKEIKALQRQLMRM